MKREVIEVQDFAVEVSKDIERRIHTSGVRGLNFEEAKKLGVFERLGSIMCATHMTVMAAYMIYGYADYIIDELGARNHEIKREMNLFDKAFDRFVRFWTSYYDDKIHDNDVAFQSERLEMQIMKWMELPINWELGDEQRVKNETRTAIRITIDGDVYTFSRAKTNIEIEGNEESWGVLKYDRCANKQDVIHDNVDKASAMMAAKRLSDNDKDNIYTVAIIRDVVEKYTEITPYKVYRNNQTIGKITKEFI